MSFIEHFLPTHRGGEMTCTTLQRAVVILLPFLPASSGAVTDSTVLPVPIQVPAKNALGVTPVIADGDTFPLSLLANLEFSDAPGMAFGDSDHDGANELAFTGGFPLSYRIWEHGVSNAYSLEASGSSYLITYAMGDVDQDGRSEIIGQTSGYVQVFESVDRVRSPF